VTEAIANALKTRILSSNVDVAFVALTSWLTGAVTTALTGAARPINMDRMAGRLGRSSPVNRRGHSLTAPSWTRREMDRPTDRLRRNKTHSTQRFPDSPPQTPFTRYNRLLSKQLNNRLNNWLHRVNKRPTGCQTGCSNGLTTGWMFVYAMQPVVQPRLSNRPPVEQPVVQPLGCLYTRYNRLDNRS